MGKYGLFISDTVTKVTELCRNINEIAGNICVEQQSGT